MSFTDQRNFKLIVGETLFGSRHVSRQISVRMQHCCHALTALLAFPLILRNIGRRHGDVHAVEQRTYYHNVAFLINRFSFPPISTSPFNTLSEVLSEHHIFLRT